MAANSSDTAENAPFIVPDEKLYAPEVAEIAEVRSKLKFITQAIQSDEAAAAGSRDPSITKPNPTFDASASTTSLTASINDLTLHEKRELKMDLDLRLAQLLTIVTQDKKNPIKMEEDQLNWDMERQRYEDEEMDRVYHRGMKWTIGVAIGFGLMCIMVPATALLLVQKGII